MFELPELPYAHNALEPYIDGRTMQIHHSKHHAAYVKNLNEALENNSRVNVEELLRDLGRLPDATREKVRNNGGGHYNHSLFWLVMAANPTGEKRRPNGGVEAAINSSFGSFETFQEKFNTAAISRFGSGWAWLSVEKGRLVVESSPYQDSPIIGGRIPILGLDVWEHAYYLKYQNMRADYVKAWWNVVNWTEVESRFVLAMK